MAAPTLYTAGIGGSSGATFVSLAPLYASGAIWYVCSLNGVNGGGAAGRNRNAPLATVLQAYTNASAGDIIVCLSGHAETIATSLGVNKTGLMILGEGQGASRPRFTRNADITLFATTAQNVGYANLYFPASTAATTGSSYKVSLGSTGGWIADCFFECGANDTGPALRLGGGSYISVRGITFLSTAVALTAQPGYALRSDGTSTDFEMDNVTFDGGAAGWTNQVAMVLDAGVGAFTNMRVTNVDLLNDSDVDLTGASTTTGIFHVRNKSGSSRVIWTA